MLDSGTISPVKGNVLQRKEMQKSAWFCWSTDQPQKLRNEGSLELCKGGFQRDPGSHYESIRHASFWQAETFPDISNRDGIAICHVLRSVFDLLSDVDSIHDIVPRRIVGQRLYRFRHFVSNAYVWCTTHFVCTRFPIIAREKPRSNSG